MIPSVAIIIPVLARPHRVAPVLAAFHAATPEPHRVLFVADHDDTDELAALRAAGADAIVMDTEPRGFAAKINAGYHATDDPWIFTAADDLYPHRDWFSRALEWAKPEHGVIGTNDIANPGVMAGQHSTHSLIRRSYVERCSGVIDMPNTPMCPLYRHEYTDTELVGTARFRGAFVMAYDSIVEHRHPAWDITIPMDSTYKKGQAAGPVDQRTYQRRMHLWSPSPIPKPVPRPRVAHQVHRRR